MRIGLNDLFFNAHHTINSILRGCCRRVDVKVYQHSKNRYHSEKKNVLFDSVACFGMVDEKLSVRYNLLFEQCFQL